MCVSGFECFYIDAVYLCVCGCVYECFHIDCVRVCVCEWVCECVFLSVCVSVYENLCV